MPEFFRKIELPALNITSSDFDAMCGDVAVAYNTGKSLLRYMVVDNMTYDLAEMMDPYIEPTVLFAKYSGVGQLYPHRDHGPKTVLNYYVDTENCETRFYTLDDESEKYTKNVFKKAPMRLSDSFIAKDGDFYLLNVDEVHSVDRIDKVKTRRFISWQWPIDYNTILEALTRNNK